MDELILEDGRGDDEVDRAKGEDERVEDGKKVRDEQDGDVDRDQVVGLRSKHIGRQPVDSNFTWMQEVLTEKNRGFVPCVTQGLVRRGREDGRKVKATHSAAFARGEILPASKDPLQYRQAKHAELEERVERGLEDDPQHEKWRGLREGRGDRLEQTDADDLPV